MRIAISATNPCHLYELARKVHRAGHLSAYYSGYPGWSLRPATGFPLRAHSWRTVAVYAALRLPPVLRPPSRVLFRWQDDAFDRWVGRVMRPACRPCHARPMCRDVSAGEAARYHHRAEPRNRARARMGSHHAPRICARRAGCGNSDPIRSHLARRIRRSGCAGGLALCGLDGCARAACARRRAA